MGSIHTSKSRAYTFIAIMGVLLLSSCGTAKSTVSKCRFTEEHFAQTQQKAVAGDAEAQLRLGDWYRYRYCGLEDYSQALDWYRHSAEQGNLDAQRRLGSLYLSGRDWAPQDIKQGIDWYRKAAGQGDASAARTLGNVYLDGKYVPKDLDEAKKWFSFAAERGDHASKNYLKVIGKEKDPAAWERKQNEILAAEKEQQRRLVQEKHAKQKEEVRQRAKKAKARYGLVTVSIVEDEKSIQARAKIRKKLKSLPEPRSDTGSNDDPTADDIAGAAVYSTLYGGPFMAAGVVVGGVMVLMYRAVERQVKTSRTKAKAKPAVKTLTQSFAQEKPAKDFTESLVATAAKQQAPNLLVSTSKSRQANPTHQLKIDLKELRLVTIPGSGHLGRLWVTTEASLTSLKSSDPVTEKSFCYGSSSFPLKDAANDLTVLRKHLNNAYRNLSSQILTQILQLAPDPDAPRAWGYTEKLCSPATPTQFAGKSYSGEMKDGKPHGRGEMRYPKGEWVSIYRGEFVDGEENGEGRCKTVPGGWRGCTYMNGNRVAVY